MSEFLSKITSCDTNASVHTKQAHNAPKVSSWSSDMKGDAGKAWTDMVSWHINLWGSKQAQKVNLCGFDMKGRAANSWRDCQLARKSVAQLHQVVAPCDTDHQVSENKNKTVGDIAKVCAQTVLRCLYFARIGRSDVLWTVKKHLGQGCQKNGTEHVIKDSPVSSVTSTALSVTDKVALLEHSE